jgi:hypothetical protein
MNGKSEEQIRSERADTIKMLEKKGYEVVDTIFPDFDNKGNVPLKYLAKSIEAIASVDFVFFMPGWKNARGCKIEHECCVQYDIKFDEADDASTVKMKKGNLVVNIRNTENDIFNAKTMGYVLVDEEIKLTQTNPTDSAKNENEGKTGTDEITQTTTTEKTGLAVLSKKELAEYIGKRKLYDRSYKDLEPDAIIPLFIKSVQAKIVDAKLKTADEVMAIAEKELLELFDTLK